MVAVSVEPTDRLFVYGIFLGENMRNTYGMTNPRYATVPSYVTFGDYIVEAHKVNAPNIQLTGLTVDVDPEQWARIDRLESGYNREIVTTSNGERVYMYVGR